MITIEKIDPASKKQVNRFINFPLCLYADHPYRVPLLSIDARLYLNRKKFHFYDHSDADFFIATRNGRDVGRIAILEHRLFNAYHNARQAQFYFFDCEQDEEAAATLFERAFAWARQRDLDKIVGPKGFGALDNFGILIQGFDQLQTMSFTAYNYEYYQQLVERMGFTKEVDFISCRLEIDSFHLPDWLHRLAEQVRRKEALTVETFPNLNQFVAAGHTILQTYNQSFTRNWEYYPLPEREIDFIINNLKPVARTKLSKMIKHQDDMVGFILGLPDLSRSLHRAKGRLTPISLLHLLWEKWQQQAVVLAAVWILDSYQLQGGNALLISEIEKTFRELGVRQVELVNMADTAVQIRRDLNALGIKPHKIHRVYVKNL